MEEYESEVNPPLVLPNTDGQVSFQSNGCFFPVYFVAFATVFLLSVTLLPYLGSWAKSFIILLVTLIHGAIIFLNPMKQLLNCSERLSINDEDRYGSQITQKSVPKESKRFTRREKVIKAVCTYILYKL